MTDYEDVDYTVEGTTAVITINRPERYNAFRGRTVEELIRAFRAAWADRAVQAVILTGAGEKAFCTGGDVKQRAETGDYGPTESGMFEIGYLHKLIRDIPKPVIAAVNGVAVGGGHVLHVLCDLSIASETARFGQAGPKVGSFDAGFGSAYLARVVGEKRAREIWYLCRLYDAATAERWGLVNAVVPADRLMDRGEGVGGRDRREEPDGAALPQAVVQRRHRPPGGPVQPRDVRARPVHRVAGGPGGRRGVRREAAAGLRRARRRPLSGGTTVMDFALTPTQVEFRDRARAVAEKLAPDYQARERAGRIDPELRREIGAAGLIAPELPGRARRAGRRPAHQRDRGRGDRPGRHQRRLPAGGRARWSGRSSPRTPHPRSPRTGCRGSAAARRSSGSGSPSRTPARTPGCRGCRRPRRRRLGAQRQQVALVRPRRRRRRRLRPHRPVAAARARTSAPSWCRWTCPASPASPCRTWGRRPSAAGWRT